MYLIGQYSAVTWFSEEDILSCMPQLLADIIPESAANKVSEESLELAELSGSV